ncbi:hypothetical protein COCOBI_11-5300 [Coccomyxa sp. Obi]|nr:hypothetical protein COCOBI_11-5300 [Coccomyxa sp. Obi]
MPGEAESEELVAVPVSENTPQQVDAPEAKNSKERLSESVFREMLLCEAVLLDPVRGWRMWESKYKRDYDESSEVFPQKLEYLLANAREVQDWNRKHCSNPKMPKLALNNLADEDPNWMLTPSNVGCIPYEEYISELKKDELRQAPKTCGSEKLDSHSKPSLSGKVDPQKTSALIVTEDAAQQVAAPEADKEKLSESDLREMELYEVVLHDPIRGWRMWESKFKRDYDETSAVFPEKLENLQTSAKVVEKWRKRGKDFALNNWSDMKRPCDKPSKLGYLPFENCIAALKRGEVSRESQKA